MCFHTAVNIISLCIIDSRNFYNFKIIIFYNCSAKYHKYIEKFCFNIFTGKVKKQANVMCLVVRKMNGHKELQ